MNNIEKIIVVYALKLPSPTPVSVMGGPVMVRSMHDNAAESKKMIENGHEVLENFKRHWRYLEETSEVKSAIPITSPAE